LAKSKPGENNMNNWTREEIETLRKHFNDEDCKVFFQDTEIVYFCGELKNMELEEDEEDGLKEDSFRILDDYCLRRFENYSQSDFTVFEQKEISWRSISQVEII
jgi:hypothetical protein